MKIFRWNAEKNVLLQTERGISFEVIEWAIAQGQLLDVLPHPNQERYPKQRIFVVRVRE
jgi:hypothetical protein